MDYCEEEGASGVENLMRDENEARNYVIPHFSPSHLQRHETGTCSQNIETES